MFQGGLYATVIHDWEWAIFGGYSCLTVGHLRQLRSDLVVAITFFVMYQALIVETNAL